MSQRLFINILLPHCNSKVLSLRREPQVSVKEFLLTVGIIIVPTVNKKLNNYITCVVGKFR